MVDREFITLIVGEGGEKWENLGESGKQGC
jgi:hypothetical protein